MEFDGILWTPITLTTMLTARLCMGGNGLGPEMGNFRTWSRRERQRPVAAVIVIAKYYNHKCHWPPSVPFLIHSTAQHLVFPYFHICLHMKREFQKDVSPQMQVWWAALHLGECILDNFFFSSQRINTAPTSFCLRGSAQSSEKSYLQSFCWHFKELQIDLLFGQKIKNMAEGLSWWVFFKSDVKCFVIEMNYLRVS